MFNKLLTKIYKLLNINMDSESDRSHIQFLIVYIVLALVSFFMTAVNIFTGWKTLAIICAIFGVCCLLDIVFELVLKLRHFGRAVFGTEFIAMFTAFLIIGEPEGFSVLWMLLLPSCGFFLFGLNYGLLVSGIQFVIATLLLWIPAGTDILQYPYTDTFHMRFPIVYLAFSFVGILMELVRMNAQKQLRESREKYEFLYNHDALTGLYNRYGFNSTIDEFVASHDGQAFSFGILDLDKFKNVNDTYGHLSGDVILKETASVTRKHFEKFGYVCRWGGEEFSVLMLDQPDPDAICWELIGIARTNKIILESGDVIVQPFSMGLVKVQAGQHVDIAKLINQADNNLYYAKSHGRNQVVSGFYED